MKQTHRTTRAFASRTLLGALAALIVAPAFAQSPTPGSPPTPGDDRPAVQERERRVRVERHAGAEGARREAMNPEHMRERLERRRADLLAEQARIDNAIQMLDKGATPQEVWEALRPPMPEGRPGAADGEPRRPHGQMRGPHGPGPHGAHGEGMPPEVRERIERVIRERNPEAHRRMMELRERRPEAANRLLDNLAPRMQELSELSERDPALFELRAEALRLDLATMDAASTYIRLQNENADGAALDEAMNRLRGVVGERMALGARERAHHLQAMSRRLEALQQEIGADDAKRNEMIDRAVKETLERAKRHGAKD